VLLDFAKPHAESYMLGRVVIVAMPFYVLVFVGKGVEAQWEAFLPTFRQMLKQFHLTSAVAPEVEP
jgi:cytochrome b